MAYTWSALRKTTDDELVAAHDETVGSTIIGLNYHVAELARRDQDRQTPEMLEHTRQVTKMTRQML